MTDPLNFEIDGAALHAGAALSLLEAIEAVVRDLPGDRAGLRLHGLAALGAIAGEESLLLKLAETHRPGVRPVRAILFDKTAAANWALGWHQDRTIAVASRIAVPGFAPWTVKQGMLHVEPPFEIIERMVTLRVHLDDVPSGNAPLRIARGSHRSGRIVEANLAKAVESFPATTCLARRGDVWAYATPIIHASDRGNGKRRRVLQIDYSADRLPGGLEWLGV